MKILTVRQPWASLIVRGIKDVENRTWPTRYRGPVLIHAAKRPDDISVDDIARRFGVRLEAALELGGVVGITEIVDCVRPHPSAWYARGHHGFVLANSRPLPFVRWTGGLSLRNAPIELMRELGLDDSSNDEPQSTIRDHFRPRSLDEVGA